MEDRFGKEHEEDILAAFDRMKEQYKREVGASGDEEGSLPAEGGEPSPSEEAASEASAAAGSSEDAAPAGSDGERLSESEEEGRRGVSDDTLMVASSLIAAIPSAVKEEDAAGAADNKKADKMTEKRSSRAEKSAKKSGSAKKAERSADSRKPKKKKRHIFLKILLALLALCLAAGIFVGYKVWGIIKETPEINPANIYDLLTENSEILDKDGNHLQNVYSGSELRTNVSISDVPEVVKDAFISIEDKTFYDHHGFNFIRIFGAIWQKVSGQTERIGGTSTISQQLARNLYLSDIKSKRSYTRKIQEAYYTIVIERALTKDQILEAYLNTVYLGFNCNGVEAASEAYFNKSVKDLDLVEASLLASLPQSPNNYAPIKRIATEEITDPDSYDIIEKDEKYTLIYNNAAETRRNLVLWYMHDQGKIDDATYEAAKAASVRDHIDPGTNATTEASSSYFTDYVISRVMSDLQTKLGYDYDKAYDLVYRGGLVINSTLDQRIQDQIEAVYAVDSNFADVNMSTLLRDKNGNILYADDNLSVWKAAQTVADPKDILIYSKDTYFDEDGSFTLRPSEFEWLEDGSLKVFKGNRLNIYKTQVQGSVDYSVEFKGLYEIEDKKFYYYSGGNWVIAPAYKDRDDDGNLILSAQYFLDRPNAFTKNDDGSLTLSPEYFSLVDRIIEPQSAMVVMESATGKIVGMLGGRGIEGRKLYNRATSTRQPGSSIKPLAVYSSALQAGVDGLGNFTVAMPIDDIPIAQNGKIWPKNWYVGYRGIQNMRYAVEQSTNTCAVNLFLQLDINMVVQNLQNMGITSLVTTGTANDMNAAALALGGMTKGISPLEMCGAYATFGNYGTYIEPNCYTTVVNRRGDVILSADPITHKVYDESVASLMLDVLRTTVTNGLSSAAKLKSQPSAGKTGTTSDSYDLWFCGLTPKYTGVVWMGNDMNVELRQASSISASVWAKVMEEVGSWDERGTFEMRGEFVKATVDRYSGKLASEASGLDDRSHYLTEIFIKGTEPHEADDAHKIREVCSYSGYLATPMCSEFGLSTFRVTVTRPCGSSLEKYVIDNLRSARGGYLLNPASVSDSAYDTPDYYCPFHNPDTSVYPVSPYFMATRSEELETYVMPDQQTEEGGEEPQVNVENDGGGDNEYDIPPTGPLEENAPAAGA